MRAILTATAMILLSAGGVSAVEYRTPVTKQLFTCSASGVSRVALQDGPAPCCDGRLKCAQFLSTTGVLRQRLDPRT